MTWLEKLNQTPPAVVRLYAHKGGKPMTGADICLASGLSHGTVSNISNSVEWNRWPADVIERFTKACGVDLSKPGRVRKHLREKKLVHLQVANPCARAMFDRMLRNLDQAAATRTRSRLQV